MSAKLSNPEILRNLITLRSISSRHQKSPICTCFSLDPTIGLLLASMTLFESQCKLVLSEGIPFRTTVAFDEQFLYTLELLRSFLLRRFAFFMSWSFCSTSWRFVPLSSCHLVLESNFTTLAALKFVFFLRRLSPNNQSSNPTLEIVQHLESPNSTKTHCYSLAIPAC